MNAVLPPINESGALRSYLENMLILCVDDDPDDIEFLCDAARVTDQRCVCLAAKNGKDALTILQTIKPDLILLDVNMPVMNGKETLRRIRKDERFSNIPIFMLSTTNNRDEMHVYTKMGAKAFFTKPTSFEELCSMLKAIFPPANPQ